MTTPFFDDAIGSVDKISPRHVFETRIQILLQRDNTRLSLQGWARNLSESGLGAFVAEALILGESVALEIPLPDCDKQTECSQGSGHSLIGPGTPRDAVQTENDSHPQ